MADTEYWFARYRLNPTGRGVMPLNWKGRAVIQGFVLGIVGGALLFLPLAVWAHQVVPGAIVFAICAIAAGATFIWAAMTKSDPVKTVADYRASGALK